MKKNWLRLGFATIALGALTFAQSCSVSEVVNYVFPGFTYNADAVEFTIPIVDSAGTTFASFDSVKVELNLEDALRENTNGNISISDADKIYIESVRLDLTDADNENNWANFTDVNMMMASNTATTVVEMAKATIPDTYDESIDGTVDQSVSMKEYVKGNTIYYVIYGKSRRATNKELHGKAYVSFRVE